ncbi:putative DNA polymerase zeta catalytic subunit [Eremomyces bilateralis CBS 781.70]|uniref:DNA polymerase n=1 Tax=Eremomyces bilateralis CBS 781.70 TaxID=1392243 RepID=A0A6G1FW80_9PEZI|nr:putative DNA polymerase zeta catalytic subunit [Eremomyces bilateralis CBS 781.70]KAF1809952.1 putative DNA polymerase zeta catalytic subunit [Eremomyces bilateralis CBS 781.70]
MAKPPFPFRFRLNCVDHYQTTPSEFDPPVLPVQSLSQTRNVPRFPIVRIFGATETGQKVCAHIHGAFPYLYIEYEGGLDPDEVEAHICTVRLSIDRALAVSYRNPNADRKPMYVAHISLIKAVPFFGYSVGYKFYLKVYLLNPLHVNRLADLLVQGAILGRVIQPHESHMQYLAQWMCDYNLYGCAYIDCAKVRFRSPVPEYQEQNDPNHKWHDGSIPNGWTLDEERFPRQSHCSIEIDLCVQDILNRHDVELRNIHHDFSERFVHISSDEKLVRSMAALWKDETIRRKRRMGLTHPSSSPFPSEVLVSMSADERNAEAAGWIHEEEFRDTIKDIIDQERSASDAPPDFDKFIRHPKREAKIQTAFESITELYPDRLHRTVRREPAEHTQLARVENAFVDESRIAAELSPANETVSVEDLDSVQGQVVAEDGIDRPQTPYSHEKSDLDLADDLDKQAPQPRSQADILQRIELHKRALDRSLSELSDRQSKRRKMGSKGQSLEELLSLTGNSFGEVRASHDHFPPSVGESNLSITETNEIMPDEKEDSVVQASSQMSFQGREERSSSQLPFPVVKNPNHPETVLRVSQRTEFTSSRKSQLADLVHDETQHLQSDASSEATNLLKGSKATATSTSSDGPSQSTAQVLALADEARKSFPPATQTQIVYFAHSPPTISDVETTMLDYGLPSVIYQDAYYSKEEDVPDRTREYAGRAFKLQSNTLPFLPPFDPTGLGDASYGKTVPVPNVQTQEIDHGIRRARCTFLNWEIKAPPPTHAEVSEWLKQEDKEKRAEPVPSQQSVGKSVSNRSGQSRTGADLSQIGGPTQKNKHGAKYAQQAKSDGIEYEAQYMSIMSLEVHVNSRGALTPDPEEDEISCIFFCVQTDDHEDEFDDGMRKGILTLSEGDGIARKIQKAVNVEVMYEEEELDLINRFVGIVREIDPDILTGYEVHNGSWGYLIERARVRFEYNLCDELSRVKSAANGRFGKDADRWGFTHTSVIRITGRHMINIWRAMRGELNLLQYTIENVAFQVLQKRIPHFSFEDLTKWYTSTKPRELAKTLSYFLSRVQLNLEILDANELIPRTSEQARLLGVDFFSVFSRGSQFKVESLMFRIAKPENFILVSPSRKQVGQQNALECLPLVMEPQSDFYSSPVLVLDFQSLYPSVMIAYNYCYSTCLGRVAPWRGTNKLGFTTLERQPGLLELLEKDINVAPNGLMYVRPNIRKSLLAKMLSEILETRVMVKSGMKQDKDDKTLQQLLNNRQLALKLIANVTYGYTSASFSGRMPCAEIADSITQSGRETLERAIAIIHSVERWGAEIVYGDTDSLFIHLKGRTRDDAFRIGNEIADTITAANPRPIKLKFEKVYHPCVLLAKKRYVGFKYEHPNQAVPEFDAKGIETVRRDGTVAEQKIEETALKMLFRTADLSQIKAYFQDQCRKIMEGRASVQDFLFAKEVRLGNYSDRGPPPPGALVATRKMFADRRTEPQYGERVPYVVVTGAPGARLIDRCVDPEQLLNDDALELDAEYYISKNLIPPLERIFNLVGANIRGWYDEMQKVQRIRAIAPTGGGGGMGKTLESYMRSENCLLCRAKLPKRTDLEQELLDTDDVLPICKDCLHDPAQTALLLRRRIQMAETRVRDIDAVCRTCENTAFGDEVSCNSKDCPVFYTRVKERAKSRAVKGSTEVVLKKLERKALEW